MAGTMATRRNAITREDAWGVVGVAIAGGALAALSHARPTGGTFPDAVLTFALTAFVAWLGATAPWWALATSAGVVTAFSFDSSIWVTIVAGLATAGAFWIGYRKSSLAIERAAIAAVVVNVAIRLEIRQFFLASALVAFAAIALLVITGWLRRQRYVRLRVLWGVGGLLVVLVLAVVGMAAGAYRAKSSASAGYNHLLDGLDALDAAKMPEASQVLAQAATELHAASKDIDGPFTQLAQFVPFVAQNRSAGATLLRRAGDAADAASKTLAVVDVDQLRIINGAIDVDAVGILAGPLGELKTTVAQLSAALHDANSPWLVAPLQSRLDRAIHRADRVNQQAIGASATAEYAPAILGSDGARRYLFAFTNSAEARGVTGLMGNWSEVTITNGRLKVTASGRTARLIDPLRAKGVRLDMPAEFFTRYGQFGAGGPDKDIDPKFWSNATMPPDMPSVGRAMSQMYKAATGQAVDGVFVIDPAGLAALLDATGNSVTVPGVDQALNAGNIAKFLLLDQYQFAESDREAVLEAVTQLTVQQLLTSSLPAPQQLVEKLSPAALGGHISVWMQRDDEENFVRTIGIDNSLPDFAGPHGSADGIAVVSNNASGNKIESFLQRTIDYSPTYNASTGDVDATLTVTLQNNAPKTGYPDYVIGNIVNQPTGTNRMLFTVYSRLVNTAAEVDGKAVDMGQQAELGWNVYSTFVNIPSGGTATFTLHLRGKVRAGGYELIYRPQALPNDDTLMVHTVSQHGGSSFNYKGSPERRSVITAYGAQAWRD
jgi:hypothetical protein